MGRRVIIKIEVFFINQVTEEEFDIIKKHIIGCGEGHIVISDGKRKAVLLVEDAYEE